MVVMMIADNDKKLWWRRSGSDCDGGDDAYGCSGDYANDEIGMIIIIIFKVDFFMMKRKLIIVK